VKIPHDSSNDRPRGGCDCLPRPDASPPLEVGPAPALSASPSDTPSPDAPPGETYVLRYEDRWFGIEKRVTFEAEDIAAALALMEHEPIGNWAELTKDGTVLCRRERTPGGGADYWTVD